MPNNETSIVLNVGLELYKEFGTILIDMGRHVEQYRLVSSEKVLSWIDLSLKIEDHKPYFDIDKLCKRKLKLEQRDIMKSMSKWHASKTRLTQ